MVMASEIVWDPRTGKQITTAAHSQATLQAEASSILQEENQQRKAATIKNLLHYEEHFKVLICKEHGYAVQNLAQHLYKLHTIEASVRRQIVQEYSGLELLDPKHVPLPEPLGQPFECLGKPVKALICEEEECEYITINRSVMGQHCNKRHHWRSTKTQQEFWHDVWVQSFFGSSKQRYFTVIWSESNNTETVSGADVTDKIEIGIVQDDWNNSLKKHKEELEKIDGEVAKQDKSGWFNKTGWVEHLAKSNQLHLAHASRLPDRDETELIQATKLVETLVEKCVAGLRTLHPETRRWLRSATREEADMRPIARLQNRDSQLRYAGYLKRFICYALRVSRRAARRRHSSTVNSQPRDESDNESSNSSDSVFEGDSESDTVSESSIVDDTNEEVRDDLYDADRLFPWIGDQLALSERLLQSIELSDNEATQLEALLEFVKSFIFQRMWQDPYESGIVHFLAVLGIDEELGRLRAANDYSYMLAGMVYIVRVIGVEALLPSDKRQEQDEAEVTEFLKQRKEYLADGSYGPMSWMISMLAYGKHITLEHGNAGMIDWPSEEVMTLHGQRIYMAKFKAMVGDVISQAEHILWEELMWCGRKERFNIQLDEVEDDVTFARRGFSFTSRPENKLDKGQDWMLEQMMRVEHGRKLRRDGAWSRFRVKQYLKRIEKFRELLLFLVHLTGGQPARGPEITSLRFKNGFLQDRNIFVRAGQMMTVTRYHKSQSQFDTPKVIPRFLPWKVGQLLAVYIAYIQPFREMLSVQVLEHGWTEYVWSDDKGPWETDRMTAVIKRETAKRLGVRLTTHTYRHAAAAIGRKMVGPIFARGFQEEIGEEEEEEEEDDEDPHEMAAARGSAVGGRRYGVSSGIIKHLSLRSIDTFRPLSEKWHEFLGLESYGPKDMKRPASEGGRGSKMKKAALTTSDLQFGIEQALARMSSQQRVQVRTADTEWYFGGSAEETAINRVPNAGHVDIGLGLNVDPLTPQRTVTVGHCTPRVDTLPPGWSDGWTGSSPLAGRQRQRFVPSFDSAVGRMQNPRSPRATEEELHRAMQRALCREQVSFRSEEQGEALRAVIRNETPLVVILPTGGGKSLLFMAPACLEKDAGMTVVVVPFRQLINEFVKRARCLGITCEEWKYDTTDPATLMVVSADTLVQHRFLDFGARMKAKGILRRVFVDECHLAFTANSWRPKLAHMKKVRSLMVPTVFLTATLPPTLVFDFEESFALQYARYIRASTVRVSTQYFVHECKRGSLLKTAAETCKRRAGHFRSGEKGVVYCRSRDETEQLAKDLGCGFVHAKAAANEESIAGWLDKGGFIVATSALGTGVDYPGIVFILHAGMPYGMIDYAQESGRAGRAGEAVRSVIVLEEGFVDQYKKRGRVRSVDENAMVEYLETEGCRRAVFSSYFDGEQVVCDDGAGMARCDQCGEGEVDVQRSVRVLAEDRERVEEVLNGVVEGCTSCWLADLFERDERGGDGVDWQHRGWECRRAELEKGQVEEFRDKMRFEDGTHSCRKCGFSQKLCKTGVDNVQRCQWPHVVAAVAMAACKNDIGRGIIRRAGFKGELEVDGDLDSYTKWLGWRHKARIWEETMSNTMAVVLEFILWGDSVE